MRRLFGIYQCNAKGRDLDWHLSKDQFQALTQSVCFYCGIEPKQISNVYSKKGSTSARGRYIYNGVDRFINSKGYTTDNCVPCCGPCNQSKMDEDGPDFLARAARITQHQASKTPAPSPDVDLPQVS